MSRGFHTNQFLWELITNKSSNPGVLDNYDTNLHLKHTEPLVGCCTVAPMITGGETNQAKTSTESRRMDTGMHMLQNNLQKKKRN